MLHMRWKLLAAIAALTVAGHAWAIQVPLKYTTNAQGGSNFDVRKQLEFKTEKPAGQWQLPDAVGKSPLYALIKIGDKDSIVMLDRKSAGDKFYTRLRIDLNGNGDLRDDPEIQTMSNDSGSNAELLAQNIPLKPVVGGKEMPYAATMTILCYNMDRFERADLSREDLRQFMYCIMQSACSYAGGFDLDGTHYEVRLTDGLLNGRFDDALKTGSESAVSSTRKLIQPDADIMYISGSGSVTGNDSQPLSNYLVLGNKLFSVKVDQAAGVMNLDPAKGDATLQVPSSAKHLALIGSNGSVSMYQPAEKVSVPAGQYRVAAYQLERKDAQGDLWRIGMQGDASAPACTVAAGAEASLQAGEPFMPSIETATSGDGEALQTSMQFLVLDGSKAQMTALSHEGTNTKHALSKRSTSMPREPSWQAVTTEGEKVGSGSFEYG